jgi:hypothetical protein
MMVKIDSTRCCRTQNSMQELLSAPAQISADQARKEECIRTQCPLSPVLTCSLSRYVDRCLLGEALQHLQPDDFLPFGEAISPQEHENRH